MSAREEMLSGIRRLSLEEISLPEIPDFSYQPDLINQFKEALQSNGAILAQIGVNNIEGYLNDHFSKELKRVSLSEKFSGNMSLTGAISPHQLEGVDVAVVEAVFGVAENGALWIEPSHLNIPVLPFIVSHLVILADRNRLVANMHEAYKKIHLRDQRFGLFIAGPSKTADIEQSLVIGAHGPLSLTVLLVDAEAP